MLKLLIYLVALIKLLAIGKWYPPAHVRDLSRAEFDEFFHYAQDMFKSLNDMIGQVNDQVGALARQAEATRKKVYRDEQRQPAAIGGEEDDGPDAGHSDAVRVIPGPAPRRQPNPADILSQLRSGDEVPPGILV